MLGPALLETAASALLVGVGLAGLRRFRSRRFRPAAERVGTLSRSAEALLFAALGVAGAGALAHHAAPSALPRALEGAPALVAGAALLAWIVVERFDSRVLAGALLAVAAGLFARFGARLSPALGTGAAHTAAHLAGGLAGLELLRFALRRDRPPTRAALPGAAQRFRAKQLLKADLLGRIELGAVEGPEGPVDAVQRDFRAGALWLRPVAAVLARREAAALAWLDGVPRVPRLLDRSGGRFLRSWIDGRPLAEAGPRGRAYFVEARRLLRRIHAAGVTHNDTHKVHNWLVTPEGGPALVDFQIAGRHGARTRWFRYCAREDVRHLLKHKRSYCPEALTQRERALLTRRGWISRTWLATVKPVYVLVTRRLLGWRDNEGRGREG
jgi:hypothetical protein